MIFLRLSTVLLLHFCVAFQQQPPRHHHHRRRRRCRQLEGIQVACIKSNDNHHNSLDNDNNNDTDTDFSKEQQQRRKFLTTAVGSFTAVSTGILSFQQSAMAIPMASVDEFGILLKDSPSSVDVVEFSGPKGETIVVKLVDGTQFGIKDIVESAVDPRSPLKVQANCNEAGVTTKFVDLETMLNGLDVKKRKVYTNERVQKATVKNEERKERMRLDEEDRLTELAQIEQQEAAKEAARAEKMKRLTELAQIEQQEAAKIEQQEAETAMATTAAAAEAAVTSTEQ